MAATIIIEGIPPARAPGDGLKERFVTAAGVELFSGFVGFTAKSRPWQ
jgi:hypothetical protein